MTKLNKNKINLRINSRDKKINYKKICNSDPILSVSKKSKENRKYQTSMLKDKIILKMNIILNTRRKTK